MIAYGPFNGRLRPKLSRRCHGATHYCIRLRAWNLLRGFLKMTPYLNSKT